MEAPKKIYLQVCGDCPAVDCHNCKFEDLEDNITWCRDKIFGRDVKYTRTDAFIERMARFLEYKLNDRVEIRVPGTLIPSITDKETFIEEVKKYMKGE